MQCDNTGGLYENQIFTGFLSMWGISTSALAQWVVQNSGLPPSNNPTLIFSAVDADICWGIQFKIMNPVIVRTLDGGETWAQIELDNNLVEGSSIFASSADTAWITLNDPENGENGGIWKTTDGGESCVKNDSAFTGPGSHPAKIYFFNSINGLCTGNVNDGYWEIYTTQDGGTTWSRVPSQNIPPPMIVQDSTSGDVGCGADNSFWFTTRLTSLYRTTNMGLTWSADTLLPNIDVFDVDVAFKDTINGMVSAFYNPWEYQNIFLTSTDGGETWDFPYTEFVRPSAHRINYVPRTQGTYFVTCRYATGNNQGLVGSAFTTNSGVDWIIIDTLAHGKAEFADSTTGSSAGRGDTIFKWSPGIVGIDDKPLSSRDKITLGQNYPNPFNSSTTIQFNIPSASNVVLKVYDVHGSAVATLVNGRKSQGVFAVKFGSSDLSSGIYYYRLQVGDNIQTRKLVKF